MRYFTCGSSMPIPPDIFSKFDGVVAAYYWNLWGEIEAKDKRPSVFNFSEGKIIRSHFLYGNTHQTPLRESTGCQTIEEWVERRISRFPQVNEWVIVNEFTKYETYRYYPGYSPEEVIKYCKILHTINPEAKIIIADFKPWMLDKWLESIRIVVELGLKNNLPIELGIQTHIKTINAPLFLAQLQRILKFYQNVCPVHFIEASVWHTTKVDKILTNTIWDGLIKIASHYNIASFCPWWLNEVDEEMMPSFENFQGGSIFDKDWNLRVTNKVLP